MADETDHPLPAVVGSFGIQHWTTCENPKEACRRAFLSVEPVKGRLIRLSKKTKASIDERLAAGNAVRSWQKSEARRAKLVEAIQHHEREQEPSPAVPVDPSELRQIVRAFERFIENDHERDELVLLTTHHLQQLSGASELFKQFTRMLRGRVRR